MKQYMLIFNEEMKAKMSLVFSNAEFLEVVGMSTTQLGKEYSVLMTPINTPAPEISPEEQLISE